MSELPPEFWSTLVMFLTTIGLVIGYMSKRLDKVNEKIEANTALTKRVDRAVNDTEDVETLRSQMAGVHAVVVGSGPAQVYQPGVVARTDSPIRPDLGDPAAELEPTIETPPFDPPEA